MSAVSTARPGVPRPRTPRVASDWLGALLARALIAAGGLAVLALWWHDTPLVNGFGGWLTNAGRITGLLAGYAVVVLLVLMSRAPFLDHVIGTDRLARWHASGGRYVVSLVVAHTLLITWGYSVQTHTAVTSEGWTLLRSYPDVLMATVGGALLLGVGVLSARAVRRRVRYETWYLLHLYTYLAIALAFSHQFATGADFVTSTRARIFWAAMYLAAAGLVLWYRFAVPAYTAWLQRGRVVGVRRETRDVISIVVAVRHPERLAAQPGQFFRWRFLTPGGWWQSHPFSLSAGPQGDRLRITVKALGDHTRDLLRLRPGTPVLLAGPYGSLTPARRRHAGVLLLAGGIGITPLRALLAAFASPRTTLLVRAATPDDVVFREELHDIARQSGADVHVLVGPPGSPADVFVGHRLPEMVPGLRQRDVFVCGPAGFMAAAEACLHRHHVSRRDIHSERFEL